MPQKVTRTTLTEQVADLLIDLIRTRGLRAGDPLPGTAALSETFNVSRPVVREAIAELAGRGLLLRHQGRESIVTVPDSRHLEQLLQYRIEDARISDEHVQQYRECVEVAAARLAAREVTPETLERLDERVEAMRGAKSRAALVESDVALHRQIAIACGNELLILTLDAVTPLLRTTRTKVWAGLLGSGIGADAIVDAHASIVEHVRRGDEEGAGRAMQVHLSEARRALEVSERRRTREKPRMSRR